MSLPGSLVVLAAISAAGGVCRADVLHDTLFITDQQLEVNAIACTIGGYQVWGRQIDSQVCDDFPVPAGGRYIDTVTTDSIGYLWNEPADGVLVEVFEDLGGYPAETASWAYQATGGEITVEMNDHRWGGPLYRITATLPHEAFSLPEGNWWVSLVPIDTTTESDGYFLFRDGTIHHGQTSFVRNGGEDHALAGWWFGGYGGVWPSSDWTPGDVGESSFRVTGHEMASCVADFNGDGSVNTLDVLAFLNAWGAGDPSADMNGDGVVNTLDVIMFLNLWSAGC